MLVKIFVCPLVQWKSGVRNSSSELRLNSVKSRTLTTVESWQTYPKVVNGKLILLKELHMSKHFGIYLSVNCD